MELRRAIHDDVCEASVLIVLKFRNFSLKALFFLLDKFMVELRLVTHDYLNREQIVFQARIEPMDPASVQRVQLFVVDLPLDLLEVVLRTDRYRVHHYEVRIRLAALELVLVAVVLGRHAVHRLLPHWTSGLIIVFRRAGDVQAFHERHNIRKSHRFVVFLVEKMRNQQSYRQVQSVFRISQVLREEHLLVVDHFLEEQGVSISALDLFVLEADGAEDEHLPFNVF
eukprot:CAMPEP_0168317936 /NCGR_PEP_ID=MMETSP0213-20121227/179_1 /TAXON_ID=151035 /ORGANISM="Euplotes harpa, Strain FSP1.4" /LENGTH=225 /DNA_ID=CAMNT_0008318905 /DNA_START=459 /DNA_END=1136 /DNA_ORIENTATION=+